MQTTANEVCQATLLKLLFTLYKILKYYVTINIWCSYICLLDDGPEQCVNYLTRECYGSQKSLMCPETVRKICELVDCKKPGAVELCPETCGQSSKEDIGKNIGTWRTRIVSQLL